MSILLCSHAIINRQAADAHEECPHKFCSRWVAIAAGNHPAITSKPFDPHGCVAAQQLNGPDLRSARLQTGHQRRTTLALGSHVAAARHEECRPGERERCNSDSNDCLSADDSVAHCTASRRLVRPRTMYQASAMIATASGQTTALSTRIRVPNNSTSRRRSCCTCRSSFRAAVMRVCNS